MTPKHALFTSRGWIQIMVLAYLLALPVASALTPWLRDLPLWGMAGGLAVAFMTRDSQAPPLLPLKLVFPSLLFLASFALAFAFSDNPAASLARARHLPIGLLVFVALQVAIAERRDFEQVVAALAIVAAVFALDGTWDAIALELGLGGSSTYEDTNRIRSSLPHPNDLAILAVLAGFAASQLPRLSPVLRWPLGVVLTAAFGITAVFSQSRNLWIGLLIAAIVCLTLRTRRISRRTLTASVGFGATAILVVWLVDLGGIQDRLGSLGRVSSDGRIGVWLVAWELFQTHPLTGVGPFLFGDHYLPLVTSIDLPAGYAPETSVVEWAHNLYLEALAERGILGLAGFLVLIATSLDRTRQTLLSELRGNPMLVPYATALLAGWLAFLAMGLFDLTLGKDWPWLTLWLLVGLSARIEVFSSSTSRDDRSH